ncbi:MAG: hypothetical protein AB7O98_04830 [Hyphomonadaceae bacterium]
MKLDRRVLLGALGVAAAGPAAAQETAPQQTDPAQLITARARENRYRLDFDGAHFSGPAWDVLVEAGRAARYFGIGEEHGIAENPKLAAQLLTALAPSGYAHACVETSPQMAAEMDRAARDGADGLRALFADPGARVAFFGMREEAEWLAAVRVAAPRREQAIWGLDYEIAGDRRIIARLAAQRKPAAAAAALSRLEAASAAAWARYDETRDLQYAFTFAGDPGLVSAVRDAWPGAGDEAAWMLDTLEETLAINRLQAEGEYWRSNDRRAQYNRANLRRYLARADADARVLLKFGAYHMVRGLSHTQVFDVGNAVSEGAAARGEQSFHLMVFPGAGAQIAQLDAATWAYNATPAGPYDDIGMTPLIDAAYADAFTLIDLRPLRPLASGRRRKQLDTDLVRAVHGFDMLLVMSGSTASSNL